MVTELPHVLSDYHIRIELYPNFIKFEGLGSMVPRMATEIAGPNIAGLHVFDPFGSDLTTYKKTCEEIEEALDTTVSILFPQEGRGERAEERNFFGRRERGEERNNEAGEDSHQRRVF